MDAIRASIQQVLQADHPMTVRQVFYRLVTAGAIAKTETEYKATVVRLLTRMRRAGEIPFGWIADNTRWMRKPETYGSMEEMLRLTAETYRRALWARAPTYVEVWLEKDALAGVLYQVTSVWDVPLMVTRGYPSVSYLYEAAQALRAQRKPAYLYYFGDYDPSGVDITRFVERGIREFAPEAEIHFERVAVTPAQIALWNLPTRPTKSSDSRSSGFNADSVEVDAIEPALLRDMTWERIERHVDPHAIQQLRVVEAEERLTLARVASALKEMVA